MKYIAQYIDPVDFAVIKEYFTVGGTAEKIAKHVELPLAQINDVQKSPHYSYYLKEIQDKVMVENILDEII